MFLNLGSFEWLEKNTESTNIVDSFIIHFKESDAWDHSYKS